MSDPPGVQAALGIEAVQWTAEGDSLVVRITGRWRRRRPAYGGQPTLVVESQGVRHRFPATPEPPGLTGTPPGIWRISFTVPAALAPDLASRSWLMLGGVVVRLPGAADSLPPPESAAEPPEPESAPEPPEPESAPEPEPEAAAPEPLSAPEPEPEAAPEPLRAPEPPEPRAESPPAWVRAEEAISELAGRLGGLERDLARARSEGRRLIRRAAESDRTRREVEQIAHAERNRRRELEQELLRRERRAARSRLELAELAGAESRVRELEHELGGLRRQLDEAEHSAAAARAGRERAERRVAELTREGEGERSPAAVALRRRLGREREMAAHQGAAAVEARVPREPTEAARLSAGGPLVPDPGVPLEHVVQALRGEIEARAASEARLRARLGVAEGRFESRSEAESELGATLSHLRSELTGLRADLERERSARELAERRASELERAWGDQRARSDRAAMAIEELRQALEAVRAEGRRPAAAAHAAEDPAADRVEAERLSEALVRLRERIAPAEDGPAETAPPSEASTRPEAPPATRPWLEPVFRSLARSDPAMAGRLLLELLPAQAAAYEGSVAYDLVLGPEFGAVAVTLRRGRLRVSARSSARPAEAVDFQAFGSPARLARLITAGRFRRLTRIGMARVRGDRRRVGALEALIRTPLSLSELAEAGVRMDARMALTLVAMMVDPARLRGSRFTFALEEAGIGGARLELDGRGRPVVREGTGGGAATTTAVVEPEALVRLLAGDRSAAREVRGEESVLAALHEWVQLAQSD